LFGYTEGAVIRDLGLEHVVIEGRDCTGSITGRLHLNSEITNCYSSGTIKALSLWGGGLAGEVSSSSKITNCYSSTSVEGYSSYVGGIAGSVSSGSTISRCYATGLIISHSSYSGGITGNNSVSTVGHSFWNTETTQQATSAGGTGKTSAEMRLSATYTSAGWDFTGETTNGTEDIWDIDPRFNDGYPFLSWQTIPETPQTATVSLLVINTSSALAHVYVTALGLSDPTAYGVCWNTTGNPVITDHSTDEGGLSATGPYTSLITGLAPSTTYYVRAYATNNQGTAYGNELSFMTTPIDPVQPEGEGTQADPYLIANLANLFWITQETGRWSKHYLQTADIDAATTSGWYGGKGWEPLGNNLTAFTGSYNGNHKTISNLYINRPGHESKVGLFGILSGQVKDLGLPDVNISSGNTTGALAGRTTNASISGCFATGSVTGAGNVGGLVGNIHWQTEVRQCFTNCIVTNTSTWYSNSAGGLAGRIGLAWVYNCYTHGSVSGGSSRGGLVGNADGYDSSNKGTLGYSYSTASVEGSGSNIGGLVGKSNWMNYYAVYYDSQTSGQSDDTGKGDPKSTFLMTQQATFVDWRFDNTWGVNHVTDPRANDGYPFLRWEGYEHISNAAEITSFSLPEQTLPAIIRAEEGIIDAEVIYSTDITALTATFTIFESALSIKVNGVDQVSGETVNDFTLPVTYRVTAEDGNIKDWTVTVTPDENFDGGTGTENDPFRITEPAHLDNMRKYLGEAHDDKHFIIMNDIDLGTYLAPGGPGYNSGSGWLPIGTITRDFYGSLNGNGYAISNLSINRAGENNLGLFSHIVGATIADLGMTDVFIRGKSEIGSITGRSSISTITGCTVSCTLEGVTLTGGITGQNSGSTITGCTVSGMVSVSISQAGGIAGINVSSGMISNCSSSATITGDQTIGGITGYSTSSVTASVSTGSVTGTRNLGGIVGYNYNNAVIDGCYSTGEVTGTDKNIGGIAGHNRNSVIRNSHSESHVTGNSNVGGVAGYNESSTISACFNTGNIEGMFNIGGVAGQNSSATISNSYSTGAATGGNAAGGIVGYNLPTSMVINCYSLGTATGDNHVGGLAGYSTGTDRILNCFWDTEASGNSTSPEGTGITSAQMKKFATFFTAGWDFEGEDVNGTEGFWGIDETGTQNNGYPFLHFQGMASASEAIAITGPVEEVKDTSAMATITVATAGGPEITGHGFCWNTTGNPDTENDFTTDEGALQVNGSVTYLLTGLEVNTTYYIRAWAVNSFGTVYGDEVSFTTLPLTPAAPEAGDGSSENPYQIETLANLFWISLNSDAWNSYFIQTAHIDATNTQSWYEGRGWEPVGYYNDQYDYKGFSGSYDGQGHTIDGLFINRDTLDYTGLFGFLDEASISNLGLTALQVTGRNLTGGIAGLSYVSAITGSFVTGSVTGSNMVGGISGLLNYSYLDNSYNRASVTGLQQVGGVAGNVSDHSSLTHVYSTGETNGSQNVGGMVGSSGSQSTISGFWDTETSGQAVSAGGEGRTTAQMKQYTTFFDAGWDFTGETTNGTQDIWGIDHSGTSNDGYPFLIWQGLQQTPILTVTGATAAGKVYDGTTDAVISDAVLQGVIGDDDVELDQLVGVFAQSVPGENIEVTAALTIKGNDAYKYILEQPAGLTAGILAKELSISGSFTVHNKDHDGTKTAVINQNSLELNGIIGNDDVELANVVAEFAQAESGENITVTIISANLNGEDAGNYTLTLAGAPSATANISPATHAGLVTAGSVRVWPNPFRESINISGRDDIIRITVTNVLGQKVIEENQNGSMMISTGHLEKGIYFLVIEYAGGTRDIKRVVKQ
jgi:hypothetical protein